MRYGRRYPGNSPWIDVPPAQRPRCGRGYGRGYGLTGTDPDKCAKFPWLPRWWWGKSEIVAPTGTEREFLEEQVNILTQELETLKKTLSEISDEKTQ